APGSGDQPESLHWDLSEGHTTAQIPWSGRLDTREYIDGVDVTLELPGDVTFTDHAERADLYRDGDVIERIDLLYADTNLDEAYQRAKRLGERWGLPSGRLERWYAAQVEARRRGTWRPD